MRCLGWFVVCGVLFFAASPTAVWAERAGCSGATAPPETTTPVDPCTNVLVNPSFDDGAVFNQLFSTDWNAFGAVFAIDANIIPPGQDGDFYLKMFGGNSGVFQDHPVTPGAIVSLSVWVENASFDPMLPGCKGFLKLEYFNAGNTVISVTSSTELDDTLPSNTWTQIVMNDVAPANAVTVRAVVIMQCTAGGAVMFDDAEMLIDDETCTLNQ